MVTYEVGDLIVLHNCQTTGWKDGQVGIITKIDNIGLYNIYWIAIGEEQRVPMWDTEFKHLKEEVS